MKILKQKRVSRKPSGKKPTCKNCNSVLDFSTEEEKHEWSLNKYKCPYCKKIYCMLPRTERILRKVQDAYFDSNRKEKYMVWIYKILKAYSVSLIRKNYANVVRNDEALQYHSHSASMYVVQNYYKREEFLISTSFGKYLLFKIEESIWKPSEHLHEDMSINNIVENRYMVQIPQECENIRKVEHGEDSLHLVNNIMREVFDGKPPQANFYKLVTLKLYLESPKKLEKYVTQFPNESASLNESLKELKEFILSQRD